MWNFPSHPFFFYLLSTPIECRLILSTRSTCPQAPWESSFSLQLFFFFSHMRGVDLQCSKCVLLFFFYERRWIQWMACWAIGQCAGIELIESLILDLALRRCRELFFFFLIKLLLFSLWLTSVILDCDVCARPVWEMLSASVYVFLVFCSRCVVVTARASFVVRWSFLLNSHVAFFFFLLLSY